MTNRKLIILAVVALALGHEISARERLSSAEPKWTIDLKDKFDFQAFDRPVSFRWTLHQDVMFLSPEKLLVYQVNRSRAPARLSPRDRSGGGGNFILDMRVLSTGDGHELKSLQLVTNAESTRVIPTREGRFLVRTGDILYLYSANFERIASHELPLRRRVQEEAWQIDVSPSGAVISLVHQEILKRDPLSPASEVEKAGADVEILKEENLQVIRKFSLPWFIPSWSAGEHALITPRPAPASDPAAYGLLDYDGNWSPLLFASDPPSRPCSYQAGPFDVNWYVTYGCGALSVFPQNGQSIFNFRSGDKEHIGSVKGSGSNLAIQLEKHFIKTNAANVAIRATKPLRIEVYEVKSHHAVLSTPVHGDRAYYALTSQGALAVVDGTSLAFYQAGP